MAKKKHGNSGKNASADDDVRAFFNEDEERLKEDAEHFRKEEEFLAVDLRNVIIDFFIVFVVGGFFCDNKNMVVFGKFLQHEKLLKMPSRRGDKTNLHLVRSFASEDAFKGFEEDGGVEAEGGVLSVIVFELDAVIEFDV